MSVNPYFVCIPAGLPTVTLDENTFLCKNTIIHQNQKLILVDWESVPSLTFSNFLTERGLNDTQAALKD